MGEICAISVLGPPHNLQRSQFASSSIGVRHVLQSLATTPLAGASSSLRRADAAPAARAFAAAAPSSGLKFCLFVARPSVDQIGAYAVDGSLVDFTLR